MRRACLVVALITAAGAACSTYRGSAHSVEPASVTAEPGWLLVKDVPYVAQQGETECGAAAIGMVVAYWTGKEPASIVSAFRPVPERGIAAGRLRDYARDQGLAAFVIEGKLDDLAHELAAGRPVIVGLTKLQTKNRALDHYEVVIGLHRERKLILTLDPSGGWRQNTLDGFVREWQLAKFVTLVASSRA